MTAVLLDTCVLIDLLRGRDDAFRAVAAEKRKPCFCPVSLTEILAGARSQKEERAIDDLVSTLDCCPLGTQAFRRAGEFLRHYHSSHALDLPDALIAAAAEAQGLRTALRGAGHDVLAVEMEGAAVAQVCLDYGVPFAAVRTISDRADDAAHGDFALFVQTVASRYADHMVQTFLQKL